MKQKEQMVKYTELIARLWMGYILIKNSFVGSYIPLESLGMPEEMLEVFQALWRTNFLMHAAKIVEFTGGLALIFNFKIPFVLIGLMPVVVNIYGMHIFFFGNPLSKGLVMLMICSYFVWKYRERYLPIWQS